MTQETTATPSAGPTSNGFEWKLGTVIWLTTIGIGLVATTFWWASSGNVERGASYTALLLLSSSVLLAIGFPHRAQSPKWLLWLYLLLEVWKVALLIAYTHADTWSWVANVLSHSAITVACMILVGLLWIANWVTNRSEHHAFVRVHFFPTLCGVLLLLAHVSSDLTFALALHDRRGLNRALYAAQELTQGDHHTLTFSTGNPAMSEVVQLASAIEVWPPDSREQINLLKNKQTLNEAAASEIAFNINQWKAILGVMEDRASSWWRITLIGHASDSVAEENGELQKSEAVRRARR